MSGLPAPHRWIVDDLGTIRFYRRCTMCLGWFERTVENFTPRQRDDTGNVRRWHARCKTCMAANRRASYARNPESFLAHGRRRWIEVTRDPELLERRRESRRRSERNARADPERAARRAASTAAYLARVRADPERHAALLVKQRMNYRLRQWNKGLEVGTGHTDAVGAWTPSAVNGKGDITVDVGPFVALLDRWYELQCVERLDGMTTNHQGGARGKDGIDTGTSIAGFCQLAELLALSPRALYRYRNGESLRMAMHHADRIAIEMGRSLPELTGE